jgi:[acyl-carrier-protein] S-malonyltransferase
VIAWAATVGSDVVTVADVDTRERQIREATCEHALPRPATSEARQLRRWVTQVLVAERLVAGAALGAGPGPVPDVDEILPDAVARMEIGSVAAATLADPLGRKVFAAVTADVRVSDSDVAAYHARNPGRFAQAEAVAGEWRRAPSSTEFAAVRAEVAAHQLAAARRREYRRWLDTQCARAVRLAAGYEHPGDPRQPDNTHRH